jgi:hypothetical protein
MRRLPVPESDWIALNLALDEIAQNIETVKVEVAKVSKPISSTPTVTISETGVETVSNQEQEEAEQNSLLPPQNLASTVYVRLLQWEWDAPVNDDHWKVEFYASQTTGFDPDNLPPADMKKRVAFVNSVSFIAGGAGQTWYGKCRQVNRAGDRSSFTAEVTAISA